MIFNWGLLAVGISSWICGLILILIIVLSEKDEKTKTGGKENE